MTFFTFEKTLFDLNVTKVGASFYKIRWYAARVFWAVARALLCGY